MEQQKVTRKELREMYVGQTRIFRLSDPKRIASARVTTVQMKQEEGLSFMVKADYEAKCVSITRLK